MKTYTTMMLSILFAISSHGCGRTEGGASELTAAGTTAKQPDIRVAEATATQGMASTGVVEDGVYEVCKVESSEYAKMGSSEKKPTGPHLTLDLTDQLEINKGGPQAPVGRVTLRHFAEEKDKRKQTKPQQETTLPVINCCEGQRLGATMGFEHQKDKEKSKSAVHAIIIQNVPIDIRPKECTLKHVIVVQYCYPIKDDEGTGGWTCGEDKNTHGGDVHLQN